MVKIPLLRRQPKPDSAQAEADRSREAKGKDAPPPVPEKDMSDSASTAGKGKRIPFPLKPREQREEPGSPERPRIEITPVPMTLPGKRMDEPSAVAPATDPAPSAVAPAADPAPSTASPPDTDAPPAQFVVGTDKKIAFPKKPPAYDAVRQQGTVKVQEITPAPEAAVAVKTPAEDKTASPKPPPRAEAQTDALAMLQVLPDYLFRIGPNGVQPALGDGSRAGNDAASALPGNNGSADGQAMADENGSSRLPGKAVLEELARQHEPHTKKALETRQLQTFGFQVWGDKEAHELEVRLAPLGQSEVLALVRDVTDKVQRHNALIESRNELENHLKDRNAELIRVNKMLKGEVDLRSEQEEILKKNFHRLERLLEDTIGAITLIVEERDPHVADHQRRVGRLACAIGQDMNLRNDQMRAVRMAAQLHDLGKIFIPAEILRKPGKLTPAEMSVIKTHPDTDYRILKRIDFPISIADVVRQHHERMDGSGYPQGLKGEGILLEARILAVADVMEGMVFERPYRVAPGLEAALKDIADNKGTLYDTAVAEACLKLFAEDRFKFESTSGGDDAAKAGLDRGGQDL